MPDEIHIKTPKELLAEVRELIGETLQRVDAARGALAAGLPADIGAVITTLERAETLAGDLEELVYA
jgi:hypothetical protein